MYDFDLKIVHLGDFYYSCSRSSSGWSGSFSICSTAQGKSSSSRPEQSDGIRSSKAENSSSKFNQGKDVFDEDSSSDLPPYSFKTG